MYRPMGPPLPPQGNVCPGCGHFHFPHCVRNLAPAPSQVVPLPGPFPARIPGRLGHHQLPGPAPFMHPPHQPHFGPVQPTPDLGSTQSRFGNQVPSNVPGMVNHHLQHAGRPGEIGPPLPSGSSSHGPRDGFIGQGIPFPRHPLAHSADLDSSDYSAQFPRPHVPPPSLSRSPPNGWIDEHVIKQVPQMKADFHSSMKHTDSVREAFQRDYRIWVGPKLANAGGGEERLATQFPRQPPLVSVEQLPLPQHPGGWLDAADRVESTGVELGLFREGQRLGCPGVPNAGPHFLPGVRADTGLPLASPNGRIHSDLYNGLPPSVNSAMLNFHRTSVDSLEKASNSRAFNAEAGFPREGRVSLRNEYLRNEEQCGAYEKGMDRYSPLSEDLDELYYLKYGERQTAEAHWEIHEDRQMPGRYVSSPNGQVGTGVGGRSSLGGSEAGSMFRPGSNWTVGSQNSAAFQRSDPVSAYEHGPLQHPPRSQHHESSAYQNLQLQAPSVVEGRLTAPAQSSSGAHHSMPLTSHLHHQSHSPGPSLTQHQVPVHPNSLQSVPEASSTQGPGTFQKAADSSLVPPQLPLNLSQTPNQTFRMIGHLSQRPLNLQPAQQQHPQYQEQVSEIVRFGSDAQPYGTNGALHQGNSHLAAPIASRFPATIEDNHGKHRPEFSTSAYRLPLPPLNSSPPPPSCSPPSTPPPPNSPPAVFQVQVSPAPVSSKEPLVSNTADVIGAAQGGFQQSDFSGPTSVYHLQRPPTGIGNLISSEGSAFPDLRPHFMQAGMYDQQYGMQPHPPKVTPAKESSQVVDAVTIFRKPGRMARPARFVIILRGLPGSGKSYLAKALRDVELLNEGTAPRIHSMDDYFMTEVEKVEGEDGGLNFPGAMRGKKRAVKKVMEYCYEPEMEEVYRSSMLKAFRKTLEEGMFTFVIVDDRNVLVADFAQFWVIAKQFGYEVYLLEAQYKDPAGCCARNIHNFTIEQIRDMSERWEDAPPLYLQLDISVVSIPGDDLDAQEITEVEMDTDDIEREADDPCDVFKPSSSPPQEAVAFLQESGEEFSGRGVRWESIGKELEEYQSEPSKRRKVREQRGSDSDIDCGEVESNALSGLMMAYRKTNKHVQWADQQDCRGCSKGFSISALSGREGTLLIGPGPGYNKASNSSGEGDNKLHLDISSKNTTRFLEQVRAEQEAFKAVLARRRHRVGGFDEDETGD